MATKFQLSIPTPCHENWDAMTPSEKGRFCGSCQKQVIDFSRMSDREIAQFFKKPPTGSHCGRFMSDQLEREFEVPKKRIPWLKYFFQFSLPAFLLSLKSNSSAAQVGKIAITSQVKPVADINPGSTLHTSIIHGFVRDETDYILPGATVSIKGSRRGVAVDNNGRYFISARIGDILVVSGAGLETKEVKVTDTTTLDIYVPRMILGEMAAQVVKKNKKATAPVPEINEPVISCDLSIVPSNQKNITPFTIFGSVYDTEGNPLPGATLSIKGKKIAAAADHKGVFSIKVVIGDTILVSGLGIVKKEIIINGKANLEIVVETVKKPEEIVVIAGGITYCDIPKKKKTNKKLQQSISAPVQPLLGDTVYNASKGVAIQKEKSISQPASIISGIYPNPIRKGENVQMELRNAPEGYYKRQLIDLSGKAVINEEIWIDREARVLEMELPVLQSGNYIIVLTNKKSGSSWSEKLIIQ